MIRPKLIALALAGVLTLAAFTGCSGGDERADARTATTMSTTTIAETPDLQNAPSPTIQDIEFTHEENERRRKALDSQVNRQDRAIAQLIESCSRERSRLAAMDLSVKMEALTNAHMGVNNARHAEYSKAHLAAFDKMEKVELTRAYLGVATGLWDTYVANASRVLERAGCALPTWAQAYADINPDPDTMEALPTFTPDIETELNERVVREGERIQETQRKCDATLSDSESESLQEALDALVDDYMEQSAHNERVFMSRYRKAHNANAPLETLLGMRVAYIEEESRIGATYEAGAAMAFETVECETN